MFHDRPLEHHPLVLFGVAFVLQCVGAGLGHLIRRRRESPFGAERSDLSAILAATMTLLALIIGFTFAMAIGHYDERLRLEEAEATAISTELARADLLPAGPAAQLRDGLSRYARARILFYQARDPERLGRIRGQTDRLQAELWSAVAGPTTKAPSPVNVLAVSGMNDVLNAESRADAAWRRHVPVSAWWLMGLIAFAGNLLLGASERRKSPAILLVLPVIIAIPVFLIADVDSPRFGVIPVAPANLAAHARSSTPAASPNA